MKPQPPHAQQACQCGNEEYVAHQVDTVFHVSSDIRAQMCLLFRLIKDAGALKPSLVLKQNLDKCKNIAPFH